MTALMWAALGGHAAVVALLADKGANLDLQDEVSKSNKHEIFLFICFSFMIISVGWKDCFGLSTGRWRYRVCVDP